MTAPLMNRQATESLTDRMAGAFAGAYCGEEAWPDRWITDLEYLHELRLLADGLLDVGMPEGAD